MAKKSNKVQKPEGQVYDPKKMYQWDRDTIFTFNGIEFSIMYNSIKDFITSPLTPAGMVKVADSFSVLQNTLINMVNNGTIQEMNPLKDDSTVTEINAEPQVQAEP